MSKIFLLVLIQILFFSFLFSQTAPDSLWFYTYGNDLDQKIYSLIQCNDGSFVFTGNSIENDNSNLYLIKTNENGNELWNKTFDRSIADIGTSVYETSDAGLIITGQTLSDNLDIYLIRTNANGDTLWTKVIDNSFHEQGNAIIQTEDGGFLITGNGGISDSVQKLILLKTDGNGNVLWINYIGNDIGSYGKSLQQTSDGGFIVTGHRYTDFASCDLYLVKTDAYGDTLWTKGFCVPGNYVSCYGNDVKQTNDGGFIAAGLIEYDMGGCDIFIIRTDEFGETLWINTLGYITDCGIESIDQTDDGGFIMSGWRREIGLPHPNIYILKTDILGDSLWSKSFGGIYNDVAFDLVIDSSGDYIITGYTDSTPSQDSGSPFLLKLGYETNAENDINLSHFSSTNFPNPFNPTTTIKFSIQNKSKVKLSIFNMKGQIIKTLINASLNIGDYSVIWDGEDDSGKFIGSGVYLYQIKTPSKILTKRMMLLK